MDPQAYTAGLCGHRFFSGLFSGLLVQPVPLIFNHLSRGLLRAGVLRCLQPALPGLAEGYMSLRDQAVTRCRVATDMNRAG